MLEVGHSLLDGLSAICPVGPPMAQWLSRQFCFLAFVTTVGTAIVKIYEWRRDVLYVPYLAKRRSEPNRPR
jgi:hypothetical protein